MRMNRISTQFITSPQNDVIRLLHTAHLIQNHFYHINQFVVIPELNSDQLSPQIIIFPHYNYARIPRFWRKVKNLKPEHPLVDQVSSTLIDDVSQLLAPQPQIRSELIESQWNQVAQEIFKFLYLLTPDNFKHLKKIMVRPSNIGSICSYNEINTDNQTLEIYLRQDANIFSLVEAIVSALTYNTLLDSYAANWSELEIVSDWLVGSTHLNQILSSVTNESFKPTISYLRSPNHVKLHQQSANYLAELGFKHNQPLLYLQNNRIFHQNKPLRELTMRDEQMLKTLITKGQICHDELADILFNSPEDFSLYAINKAMQRLRDRLEFNGISGSIIKTVRGEGYSL